MSSWKHADAFPIIAKTIERLASSKQGFITHDEIVQGFLDDPAAAAIIEDACRAQPEHTQEWIAHNMVAWFSKEITTGESDWTDGFDRQQYDDKWAYRPKSDRAES